MKDCASTPLVSDDLLTELAHPTSDALRGEFDNETRALLAMAVPEMAAELQQWRRAARQAPAALSLALRSAAITERLETARAVIRQEAPMAASTLRQACETLQRHSTIAAEQSAACDILRQMGRAA